MKKILFITSESLVDPKRGTPIRIYNFIHQISKAHDLFVAAPAVDERVSGRKVAYAPCRGWRRIKHYVDFIKREQIEVVMTATEINLVLPVLIKLFTGVKIAVDLHGLYGEELYYEKIIGRTKKFLLESRTRFFIRFYDLVIVCSTQNKGYYKRLNKNIEIVFDGLDVKKFFKMDSIRPTTFTIGYSGNGKPYQGLNFLLEACGNIKKKNSFPFRLKLVLSSGITQIKKQLNNNGLDDVTELHFSVTQEEANGLTNQSSVLVVPRPSLKLTEYAYPSKLPKDLITGIPTIATAVGPVKDLFGPSGSCIVIAPDAIVDNLEKALTVVYNMTPEEREIMGNQAIKFVQSRLTWDILGKDINKYLENL